MISPRKQPSGAAGLWLRWVLTNAIGEAIGLGGTAVLLASAALYLNEGKGAFVTVLLAALAVLAGTLIEGAAVGTVQWLVLRRPLPLISWRIWVLATSAGAFLAWTLGMVPSTVLSLGSGGGAHRTEPGEATVLGLAFMMGLVLGPVLGLAQWLVLRRFVGRAVLWMPANALAWAFGMLVIFLGIDLAMGGGFASSTVPILALTLVCTGAIVGAVHGLALVWLLRSQ